MADQVEKVELLIGYKQFSGWDDLEIKLCIDKFDTVSFTAPFDPSNSAFRDLFRPFSFQRVDLLLNDTRLFTGTMVGVDPTRTADTGRVSISAYAQPGVLCDCTAPSGFGRKGRRSAVGPIPLQFTKLTLRDIAAQLCEPFGLNIEFRGDPGAQFEKVAIKIDQKIHSFLVELAKQRGFVITNTGDGTLLFWKSIPQGSPVVKFVEGEAPFPGITSTFSPQEYYSEITGYAPAKHKKPGTHGVALNPWLGVDVDDPNSQINTHRPMSCKFDDTERADAPDATKAKMGRMFANMASFEIDELLTWRDPQSKLWEPNTSLSVLAPGSMIYAETELLVREVTLRQSANKLSANLGLVLPGAFSGKIPETLPWLG